MHYGVLYEIVSYPDPRVQRGSRYETIYEVVSTRDSSNGVGFVGCKQTIVLLSEVRT